MKLTNEQIYQKANELVTTFDKFELYLPARANFNIQKNIEILTAAAQEIEKTRLEVAKHYGEPSEDNDSYLIPTDKIEDANKELVDLFAIEQDLNIRTFSVEALGETQLTAAQMRAIMFMLED